MNVIFAKVVYEAIYMSCMELQWKFRGPLHLQLACIITESEAALLPGHYSVLPYLTLNMPGKYHYFYSSKSHTDPKSVPRKTQGLRLVSKCQQCNI